MTADMTVTIIPKSDQLNADDLIAGPRTIAITRVTISPGSEQPVDVHFEGDGGKPFRPGKSMRRVMVAVWGPDPAAYAGQRMTLYRDPSVTWGGMEVGGVRISHMSGLDQPMTMALTATKKARKPYRVQPLVIEPPKPAAPAGRTPRQIIEAFNAVKTAQEYYDILDAEGDRIAKLREARPGAFEQVDAARKAAAERMEDTPAPVTASTDLDDEVPT